MTYKVWSTMAPAIAILPGRRTIVGGTVTRVMKDGRPMVLPAVLPEGVGLDQIQWIRPPAPAPVKREVKKVTGSSGKVYLLERQPSGKWTCTCPGYQFRKFCKHTGAK